MEHEEFEDFWLEVETLAAELGLDVSYVEEEFIVEGELIMPKGWSFNEAGAIVKER